MIIGMLVVALGYFAFDKFVLDPSRDAELVQTTTEAVTEQSIESGKSGIRDKSIAVLPFVNMSPDPEQEYFSDGISEEILNLLAKVPELRVTSRSSAFSFKGQNVDIPTMAARLNVAHVLEGSVRKSGNQLRITAQLIEVTTDTHLWSETYDRELKGVFAIQDEIAAAVVDALKITLLGKEPKATETDPEAYALYLQGRHLCENWSPREMRQGTDFLQQAIELAPDYAAPYAQLAMCLVDSAFFEYVQPDEIDSLARTAAMKAVQLDDRLAEAHVALGSVHYYLEFDPERAEAEYLKALGLNRNSVDTLLRLSWFYAESGRFDEARVPTQHAVELDPLSTAVRNAMGQVNYLSRDFDQAIQNFDEALNLDQSDPSLHYYVGLAYEQKRQYGKAIALFESATELSDRTPLYLSALGHAYGRSGMREQALEILDGLEKAENPSPFNLAVIHLGLGNNEQAIDLLDKAIMAGNFHVLYLKAGPRFDALRDDSRFAELLARIGW
jgi:TolB-like protein/Flp pilus assembly protein TadD